ncbi:MAG: phospho-N-acetylmuramoyl-pentapeptide-transferase [Armatimonadota bacterium]|nr:phospho-N-acetylmuramoyl-pentapeptide-transferase [Armatimonadota bacterium]MDR7475264.1 phospho-N-acetylmuramoyl-pentapeptide-transferase [Armatimonadota bacterium]MDR7539575.1 phospho-N-acetylmuramoyl-pentapeptide-transferase [Armatimonadota bacterium]
MERAALAAVLAAALVLLGGRRVIAGLAAWNVRQAIREDAPARHRDKAGTPTLGGLLLVGAAVLGTLAAAPPTPAVALVLLMMLGFGGIGLLDDVLKVRRGRNLGLRARERLAAQGLLAAGAVLYVSRFVADGSTLALPWTGRVELGWIYVPFGMAFILGFVNAVNLADGLDGLAAGLCAIAAGAYAAIAFHLRQPGLGLLAAGLAGACIGFLWFNAHPAQVFMGDAGSNALGAGLAGLAILTKTELVLVVVGAVFVAEALSVLAQVAYFKATGGRRIFRMSPLHHHFELAGWTEPQTVTRFWLLAVLAALAGLLVVF